MSVKLNAWQSFKDEFKLNEKELDLFKIYLDYLIEENKKTNLTGLESIEEMIDYHLKDSLALLKFINLENKNIVDVGSGAGFPGVPLFIVSGCKMRLLEIRVKRLDFLKAIQEKLDLTKLLIDNRDWLTFIRAKKDPVDYYIARASLQPEELVKVLNVEPKATVIYWACESWQPTLKLKDLIIKDESYEVGDKKRRLIFFSKIKKAIGNYDSKN